MEFFTHPWYMAAGGALVSSPILIHLINRMRFKRIRWAAMEFLLKSQKRNRRKLIIEQMILLLLRILLVLLAAFLVARFVYGAGASRGATHLVVIDDTLSMFDKEFEGDKGTTAYETAIQQVKELAKTAGEASSTQYFRIYLLSEIDGQPFYDARLSDTSVADIETKFVSRVNKPSLMHARPLAALQKGRQVLGESKDNEGKRILHFISDFRDRDWSTGADANKMLEEIRAILDAGVNINFMDVAAPLRNLRVPQVNHHNNVAVTDLKADTRVAIEDSPVEFTVTMMNYGQAKESRFIEVYVNGEKDLTRDIMLEDLEPGKPRDHKFTLRFQRRARPGMEITERDSPEERERKRRLEREQFHVRVTVTKKGKDDDSIAADNIRDTVIELRRKVPILLIDGNKPEYKGNGGDVFHLRAFYDVTGVYETEERRMNDLIKADLDLYPGIIMVNVGEIPDPIIKKLKQYVDNGGSLAYFMGDEVKADHYNSALFKGGIFPVLLGNRPFDPLAQGDTIDQEKRRLKRTELRQTDKTPKILFPKADNTLVKSLVPWTPVFRFLSINVYWQAQARSKWDPDGLQTERLIVLPNSASIDNFKRRAQDLASQAESKTRLLADKEAKFKPHLAAVEKQKKLIINALASGELYRLGMQLEDLLKNQGDKKKQDQPSMLELWAQTDMKPLAMEINEFRERVLFGDPLLVGRQVGKGRVIAFMSTAGTIARRGADEDSVPWNNWGAGEITIDRTYPILLRGLHEYMISEGVSPARTLGEEVRFDVDPGRYQPNYTLTYFPQPEDPNDTSGEKKVKPLPPEKGTMEKVGNRLSFVMPKQTRPGIWTVGLVTHGDGPEADRTENRSFAFNVDATAEGDLKRASSVAIKPDLPAGDSKRGKLVLRVPGGTIEEFKERQPDASESSLLYLFFILILVVEQAMAVHLSYHSAKAAEQGAPGSVPAGPTPQAA